MIKKKTKSNVGNSYNFTVIKQTVNLTAMKPLATKFSAKKIIYDSDSIKKKNNQNFKSIEKQNLTAIELM